MEEFNSISWRDNLLEDQLVADEEAFQASNISKVLSKQIDVDTIRKDVNKYNKLCKNRTKCPGESYFTNAMPFSQFTTLEHQSLINALKVMHSGRTNLNSYEIADRELFNSKKQHIISESKKYMQLAENAWNKKEMKKGIRMDADLLKYGIQGRMSKIARVLKMPRFYCSRDALPWSYLESDPPMEMVHSANISDVGTVSQYTPPLLEDAFTLNKKLLPEIRDPIYTSKLASNFNKLTVNGALDLHIVLVSQDENIQEYLASGGANVAISLSALKKLLNFTDTNQTWIIPVSIRNIEEGTDNKATKKVIIFDKALPKQSASNIELNEKCHKLLLRTNFCCLEGFKFDCQDKLVNEAEQTQEDRIFHNVTYKLWTLQEEYDPMSIRKRNARAFKLLVRNKIDACTPCDYGLQGVTVVPKLEYQLSFGANVHTKEETIRQWVDLFFRPQSIVERVRIHYRTSEVIKIEKANLAMVNMEAWQYHNLKTQLNFGALYRLIAALDNHKPGNYLLKHDSKTGAFVSLLQQTEDAQAVGVLDLHHEYSMKSEIINPVFKVWCPIDGNILLSIFEKNGRFPGLLKPKTASKKNAKFARKR